VIDHGNEEVKEKFATSLHFHLHGAAALESLSASNDESEIMSSQFRVGVRRILIRKACRGKNGAALHAGLQALLAKGKRLKLRQAVAVGNTVNDRVFQNHHADSVDGHSTLNGASSGSGVVGILEAPAVPSFVVFHSRIIISFVQVLKHAREDLWLVVWQIDPLVRLIELLLAERGEKGRMRKNIFMSSEESLLAANADGYDGRCERAAFGLGSIGMIGEFLDLRRDLRCNWGLLSELLFDGLLVLARSGARAERRPLLRERCFGSTVLLGEAFASDMAALCGKHDGDGEGSRTINEGGKRCRQRVGR